MISVPLLSLLPCLPLTKIQLGGLGECCKLPSGSLQSLAAKWVLLYLRLFQLQFCNGLMYFCDRQVYESLYSITVDVMSSANFVISVLALLRKLQ